MPELSLYNSCLRAISLLLIKRFWMSRQVNPFQFLPVDILHDLVTKTLSLQTEHSFRAASLELLLTSGNIRQFKINAMYKIDELIHSFQSLSTACQNLEVLELTELPFIKYSDASKVLMTELVRNSPNLKYIHSEVEFDLKALRQCKKLQTVMLHFHPTQPWYDFLEDEQGSLQSLNSLEVFTICEPPHDSDLLYSDNLIVILQHCPAIISLGFLSTSRALAYLHCTGVLPKVKLRCCHWRNSFSINSFKDRESEWIRDAMIYHPFVEELYIDLYSRETIARLSTLRNLVFLDILFCIKEDINVLFYNVLKDIGLQLKYLSLAAINAECSVDIKMALQKCANLEVLLLIISKMNTTGFDESSVSLPNLKYLRTCGSYEKEQRLLSLFFDCNNIMKLKTECMDDETLDKFLRRNSLSNLKFASFRHCGMTQRGFKKLFLNAPELEIIIAPWGVEREIKKAMLETNHKALFKNFDMRETGPFCYDEHQLGVFDEFIFKKRGCYLSRYW